MVAVDGSVGATQDGLVTAGGSEAAMKVRSEMVGSSEAVTADGSERAMVDGSDTETVDVVTADGSGEGQPTTAVG